MAGRIIRLICLELMALWISVKLVAFVPLFAIPFIGVAVWFAISEVKEIKYENQANKKSKRNKKVKKAKS